MSDAQKHRRSGLFAALLAGLTVAMALHGCAGETAGDDPGTDVIVDAEAGVDGNTTSADTTTSEPDTSPDVSFGDAAPSNECPGGPDCPCAQNNDCDSALCIETPAGDRCARHCIDECADGFTCSPISAPGGDTVTICVPSYNRLCDPCTTSKDCAAIGLDDNACIDQGNNGGFCGVRCLSDLQCPTGYGCKTVNTTEGAEAKLCVKTPETGAESVYGTCDCSPRAAKLKLTTTCSVEKLQGNDKLVCEGTRSCGDDGLTGCVGADPKEETCNGIDDDCDGKTDEDSCDDGNGCTSEVCAGEKGCASNDLDGVPCDDGNACTESDNCAKGICVPGAPKACDDGNPCTKDTCALATGCTQTADDFKPCDDDNPCTLGDTCQAQGCKAGAAKECTVADDCLLAKCSLVDGKCGFENAKTGKSCSDDDACTSGDGCDGGVCLGQKVTCDDANPCTDDFCDGTTGCGIKPNATPCDDGNLCTVGDACSEKSCKPGANKTCPDGGACLVAKCSLVDGKCGFDPAKTGKSCNDGDACTKDDACGGGVCLGQKVTCDDANVCTNDFCDGTKGCGVKLNASPCDDGNKCTTLDTCSNGSCSAGKQVPCEDGNPCSKGTCDTKTGSCAFLGLANGTTCGPHGAKCQFATCIAGCEPKKSKKCHNDSVFWFDSCGKVGTVETACTSDDFCQSAACVKGAFAGKYYVTADPDTKPLGAFGTAKFVPLTLTVTDWGGGLLQGDISISGQKVSFTGKRTGKTWTATTTYTDASGTLPVTHKMDMNVIFSVDPKKTGKALPDLFTGTIIDKVTASGFTLGTIVWNVTGKKL